MKIIFIVVLIGLAIFYINFSLSFFSGGKDISIDEMKQLAASSREILILDVRSKGEYNRGHIPEALNIPCQKVIHSPNTVPKKDNTTVIIYCESGFRSRRSQKALLKAGFDDVLHLKGDMAKWRSKNLPIE